MEIERKSERDREVFCFGNSDMGLCCFHADGKVDELRERLSRSRMIEKIIGKLSMIRRRLIPSGPVELDEHL